MHLKTTPETDLKTYAEVNWTTTRAWMCQNITSQNALHREWVWNIYSFIKEAKWYGKECVNHIHSTYMKSDVKRILRETVKKKLLSKTWSNNFDSIFFECIRSNCSKSFICIVCLIRFTFSNDLSIKVAPFEFFIPVKYNVPSLCITFYSYTINHR